MLDSPSMAYISLQVVAGGMLRVRDVAALSVVANSNRLGATTWSRLQCSSVLLLKLPTPCGTGHNLKRLASSTTCKDLLQAFSLTPATD